MKKEFPSEVIEVMEALERGEKEKDETDEDIKKYLLIMRELTQDTNDLKNMWRYILRAKRINFYAQMTNKETVRFFLKGVVCSSEEKAPVFYLSDELKSEKISSIRKCEKRLIKLYTELFGETDVLLSSLQKNIAEAVKKSEDSFVRGPGQKKLTGKRKARIAAAFVRDFGQPPFSGPEIKLQFGGGGGMKEVAGA